MPILELNRRSILPLHPPSPDRQYSYFQIFLNHLRIVTEIRHLNSPWTYHSRNWLALVRLILPAFVGVCGWGNEATLRVPQLSEIDIDLGGARAFEVSSLLKVKDQRGGPEDNWDTAFWVAMDEGEVQEALGLIVSHKDDLQIKWSYLPLHCNAQKNIDNDDADSDDAEALFRMEDGFVYILGSHMGNKRGELQKKRHFIARFEEAKVKVEKGKAHVDLEVSNNAFLLHRVINDALKDTPLIPRTKQVRKAVEDALKSNKKWATPITPEDYPINIEGAAFLPSGNTLLGLRYPVSKDGHPILVEVEKLEALFSSKKPRVVAVWILSNVGSKAVARGVRAITVDGDVIHVITGNLDSSKRSFLVSGFEPDGELVEDHRFSVGAGMAAKSQHHTFSLAPFSGSEIEATLFSNLPDTDFEGIEIGPGPTYFYVRDEKGPIPFFIDRTDN